MEQIIILILKLIITCVVVLIGGYVIPWLKNNITTQQVSMIKDWAKTFCVCAEVLFPNVGEKTGDTKLEVVTNWLNKIIADTNIQLSQEQIRSIIEESVKSIEIKEN